jgi:hypothetical protein
MECLFCHGSEGGRLSVEHLVSKPVAEAFSIDRTAELASGDSTTGVIHASRPLTALSARLACERCNNGWMNALEHDMAYVARWVNGRTVGLTPTTSRSLRRWLIKTHLVLSFIEGGTRRFGANDDFRIIPRASPGRWLYEDSNELLAGVAFAFVRLHKPPSNNFAYLVETPRVLHAGGRALNGRAASVTVVDLGLLRCVVVVPVAMGATITFPVGLRDVRDGSTFRSLPRSQRSGSPNEVVVDFGEVDIVATLDSLLPDVPEPEHPA